MTANPFEGYGTKDKPDLRKPPQWAESLLIFLLKSRDREAIPGDLLEEYRENRLPTLGQVRADFWYVRQVFDIACFQPFEGSPIKGILLFLCSFTLAAMTWMGIMEMILNHPGSGLRICITVLLACQSLITILFLMFRGHGRVRILLRISGGLIAIFGISAVASILRAAHFEGYILLIGLAQILQGGITVAAPALRGGDKIGGYLPESHLTP